MFTIPQNRQPFEINPNSNLVGFHPTQQSKYLTSRLNKPFLSNRYNRSAFAPHSVSFQPRHQMTKYKFDYPIENVIMDKNIPPSLAIKINDAVEYDRFGNAYFTHHYLDQFCS